MKKYDTISSEDWKFYGAYDDCIIKWGTDF